MSEPNLLQRAMGEVADFFKYLMMLTADPEARRAILLDAGHAVAKNNDGSEQLVKADASFEGITAYRNTVDPDREAFRAAAADARAIARVIQDTYIAADSGEQVPQSVVDAVLQLALLNYLFRRWPFIYWWSQPLVFGFDLATTDPLLQRFGSGGMDFFSFKQAGTGEKPTFGKDWLAILGTGLAALLEFVPKGETKERFRMVYGWEPGRDSPTPTGDALLRRALSIQYTFGDTDIDDGTPALASTIGVTIVSSPHDEEPSGTLIAFNGAGEFQRAFGGWLLKVGVQAADAIDFFFNPDWSVVSGGPQDGRALVTLERKRDPTGQPWVLPIRGKTRLEFGQLLASCGVSTGGFEARLVAQKSAFVLESGDDELLKRGLKSGVVRTEFDLGLAYTNGKVSLDGAAALQATLPAQKAIGPVEIRSVTLGVRVGDKPEQPDHHDLNLEASVTLVIKLGGVTLTLDRVGCTGFVDFGSGAKPTDADFSFKEPSGIGLKIDTDVITGGGYIFHDAQLDQYAGAVELKIKNQIDVKAIAILSRKIEDKPAFSLLLIISAEGFRPLDIGMGFRLTGIGGIFGVDRAIQPEVLEKGVKTGALDMILFPKDPIGDAPRIIATANSAFPATLDRNLLGLMARIVWGVDNLVTIDLAVVVELAGLSVRRIALLGKVRTAFPKPDKPVVSIELDLVGTIDRDRKRAFAHLAITVGKIGIYKISGEAAMLYTWGDQSNYVISVGGFNPRFQKPDNFPALERVKFSLAKNKNLTVEATFYVAITSNSFQIGGSLDIVAKKSKFALKGGVGIDALIQSQQPCYAFDLRANLELLMFGEPMFAVRFKGELLGDKPWTISGKATFEIWIFDYTVDFSHTWGETEEELPPPSVDLEPVILRALEDRRNWTVTLPAGSANPVVLRRLPGAEPQLNPLGSLFIAQRVAPLAVPLARSGNARIQGTSEFRIRSLAIGKTAVDTDTVTESFAPAQFLDMTDDEKLAAPAFEDMQSGIRTRAVPVVTAGGVDSDQEYKTVVFNSRTRRAEPPPQVPAPTTGGVVKTFPRFKGLFAARPATRVVRLGKPGWRLATPDGVVATPPAADTPAPAGVAPIPAVETPAADLATPARVTFAATLGALHAERRTKPHLRAGLQLKRIVR